MVTSKDRAGDRAGLKFSPGRPHFRWVAGPGRSPGLVVHEVLDILGQGNELGNLGDDRLGGHHHPGDAPRILQG